MPGISVIPMIQHNGVHAFPVVAIGDHVEEGELIGRGQGAGSANIHSPVPGNVVQMVNWKLPEKITNAAIVIRLDGKFDLLGKAGKEYAWENLSAFELRALMAEKGVIEMDGSGRPLSGVFPGAVSGVSESTLVVRCVFDDPWLAADYCLCMERPEAVAEGACIAAKAAGVQHICFAVSSDDKQLAGRIIECMRPFDVHPEIVPVNRRYPQRYKIELTRSMRLYEKRENKVLGSLVFLGPSTLAAIYDAVKFRKPVLDRYVAVGGSAIKKPRVLKVRIGTRITDVFKECGGYANQPKRIAVGSPMNSRAIFSTDEPIIKTTYAVFAVAKEGFSYSAGFFDNSNVLDLRSDGRTPGKKIGKFKFSGKYVTAQHCINCGECREVCPAGLDPEDIYKNIRGRKHGLSVAHLVMRCHGCGCCEAVCPSNLPLCTAIINPAFKGD